MNNELYRKLTSITLMTIMFAGGMTIAIPGETPVAIAQTGMLSVSATAAPDNSFGGPQVIQIVVDDPSRSEIGTSISQPDVTVDGTGVTMTQADTGKWYAYVASVDLSLALTDLITTPDDVTDGDTVIATTNFLDDTPRESSDAEAPGDPIRDIRIFDFDGDVEIALGSESITLNYDQDLDSLATVSVDRNNVPNNAHVHVTVSDFRLNLDPTTEDVWYMTVNGDYAQYAGAAETAPTADEVNTAATAEEPTTNWQAVFEGDDNGAGEFAISNTAIARVSALEGDTATTPILVRFEETGANTGVFTSEDSNDESNIKAMGNENDDFTIDYADADVQVFIESFDSILELIADGTWDAGESLTIRVTDKDIDLNTLNDYDMKIGDPDLAVLMIGTPITLGNVATTSEEKFGEVVDINADTHVLTLTTAGSTTLTIQLTDSQLAQLEDTDSKHYINYLSALNATTDADIVLPDPTMPVSNGDQITLTDDADGTFTVTFTAPDDLISQANKTANTAIQDTVRNATIAAAATGATPQTVQTATLDRITDAPSALTTAITSAVGETNTAGEIIATAATVLTAIEASARANIWNVTETVVADIFTFGADANHAIYRALLEETGDGTAVFEGTVTYTMLNQINVNDADTHKDLTTIDDELAIILNDGYTGTDAPEVAYGGDHVRENAPTYTGEVSFDADTYGVTDTVTVTLVDPDLNTDSDAVDIYPVDARSTDATATLLHLEIGEGCTDVDGFATFSLRESTSDSGTFEGTFDVPATCGTVDTTGEDISATYYDFRDASGGTTEWGDSATIGADTGSVSFDRTVYPVPAIGSEIVIYVSVDDADYDESSSSVNEIAVTEGDAPVTVRKGSTMIAQLGTADKPLEETDVDTGIFEYTLKLENTEDLNIEQGDIITVRYDDPTDASGNENSVSDSATFDLRNAVLQSDKSTYVIGQDALLTLIEPDLNLDSGSQETIHIDRIEWDSDAETTPLGHPAFGAVPSNLRETDANTGIFQVVITIPEDIGGSLLERGEEITLIYIDNGPSGADTVGDNTRDVELQIETSNFGATIELDQNVYTWTDKVFVTVVATDYNFDSSVIDEVGTTNKGEITIRVRGDDIKPYKLAETGPDTGVFTGEITLVGYSDKVIGHTAPDTDGSGPTDGVLRTNNEDGLSISFEYSDSEAPLVASALIRWNVGEVQWLEASYAATGSGIVRVIDPDMNLNPDAVDNLEVVAYSETFIGGTTVTVTETQEASGIFEGTVEFDPESATQGHRLQVTEGDIITAEYDDKTLPRPDGGDNLIISATTLIGSIVPPLERAPASNPAIVDAFDNELASVSVDQQVQITADLTSGQDRDQDFAYLVQIQNEDGVTIALSWITGTLGAGATFSPSQSWTPSETGSYTATIFVWESVSNPTALSPQLSITIDVV